MMRQPDEQEERPEQPRDAPSGQGLSARLSARLGGREGDEAGGQFPQQRPNFAPFSGKRADQHDFRLRKEEFRDRHYTRDNYDAPVEDAQARLCSAPSGLLYDRSSEAL